MFCSFFGNPMFSLVNSKLRFLFIEPSNHRPLQYSINREILFSFRILLYGTFFVYVFGAKTPGWYVIIYFAYLLGTPKFYVKFQFCVCQDFVFPLHFVMVFSFASNSIRMIFPLSLAIGLIHIVFFLHAPEKPYAF